MANDTADNTFAEVLAAMKAQSNSLAKTVELAEKFFQLEYIDKKEKNNDQSK